MMKRENFYPLTYLRPVEELRCGIATIGEKGKEVEYWWDLIVNLKGDLEEDLRVKGPGIRGQVHHTAIVCRKEKVLIEEGAEIEAYAVLDAQAGPIYIGKNTIVHPHSYLRGPLSIGPECRIGGEVAHSIFHGYSNKAHYGFVGHSYIGEWVNLGAGTTTSNLKNNYGTVKVIVNGKSVDTGQQFIGCFIGDYAKAGIGTLITTGAVIGIGASLFGGGVTLKVVPNFAWGKDEKYQWDKFVESAKQMMGRRGKNLTEPEIKMLEKIYVKT